MNRKSFLILLVLVVVLGGAGLMLLKRDDSTWRGGATKTGVKPFEKLPLNEVAQIKLKDGEGEVTIAFQDGRWVVKERRDFPANRQDVGDLLVKLPEAKVVQTENVGASLLPRLKLAAPGKDVKAEDAGTELVMSDKAGKPVVSLLLGKKVIKKEESPLPIKQETPVGRYVLAPGNPTVMVISEPLNAAEAKPARWIAKDFFKIERAKSIAMSGEGGPWKIARSEEVAPWKFADGGELDPGAAVAIANGLQSLEFTDVATDVSAEQLEQPRTIVVETFDDRTYTLKLARKPNSNYYYLSVAAAGDPARERKPEAGEKAEDKERLDKQFAESRKRFDERIKLEKDLAGWTFVVPAKTFEPLLKDRTALAARAPKPEQSPAKPALPGKKPAKPPAKAPAKG